jgi:hypothetical protein
MKLISKKRYKVCIVYTTKNDKTKAIRAKLFFLFFSFCVFFVKYVTIYKPKKKN